MNDKNNQDKKISSDPEQKIPNSKPNAAVKGMQERPPHLVEREGRFQGNHQAGEGLTDSEEPKGNQYDVHHIQKQNKEKVIIGVPDESEDEARKIERM